MQIKINILWLIPVCLISVALTAGTIFFISAKSGTKFNTTKLHQYSSQHDKEISDSRKQVQDIKSAVIRNDKYLIDITETSNELGKSADNLSSDIRELDIANKRFGKLIQ
jgi:hypothetical protein